ncbi:hypothetical protein K469DRAFT_696606 [Zopfia rhizophila CBS 207.26]|uniref:Zn(2)-C6 fungal-type domain-containing protein n=1 Tax=Zopfia rhizophila CBS 207.26 TaxID=1314779 RepID=A0A6A6DHK1_9PEZI|nr:hypothetical protein K469DRAFT_696606 [Zopfia rhizophila CBS 207.26]
MDLQLFPHPKHSPPQAVSTPETPHVSLPPDQQARKRSINSSSVDTAAEEPSRHRRPKVSRACDVCKAKKAKCSGTRPCESCAKKRLECTYEARYSRGKPPTPREMADSVVVTPAGPEAERDIGVRLAIGSHIQPRPSQEVSPAGRVAERDDGDRLALSRLSIQPPPSQEVPSRGSPELGIAEIGGQYSDTTSGLSFLHRAWKRLSNQNSQVIGLVSAGNDEENQTLMAAGDKPFHKRTNARLPLPGLNKGIELLNLYFDMVIATYRLLHRATVQHWLETVFDNSAVAERPLWQGLGRPKTAIVLVVLAMSIFHEEKAKAATSFPSVNGEAALRQSDDLFSESASLTDAEMGFPTLESAQARLIQVLYLLTSSRSNQAWYTFGHALQIVSALGLHRCADKKRPSAPPTRDYIEDQCRKRTFWVAYTLDKYMGVMFGRPRHYHDDDIDQDFPDCINDEDMAPTGPLGQSTDDCHIESLIHHAKLAQIVGKISREVYSIKPIPDLERIAASHRLGRELRQWRATLPPFLGSINPSSLISSFRRQATALKLAYSHAVILAHRPFLLKNLSTRHEMRELAKESIAECISAAQIVLESVDRMVRDGPMFHAFWWTHYVAFCALVVVYVWAIQQSNSEASDRGYAKLFDLAEKCLTHLAQATATNSPSRRYSIILQELRAEAKRKTARRPQESAHHIAQHEANDSQLSHFQNATLGVEGHWEPVFGSPIDAAVPGMPSFLDDWQTTDWLDLDSSAFGPFPGLKISQ